MELTEFVSARLDEWAAEDVTFTDIIDGTWSALRTRIDRVAPSAQRLREVEAMRQIVAECARVASKREGTHAAELAHYTLRALASIWRDHPDYDPAWEV